MLYTYVHIYSDVELLYWCENTKYVYGNVHMGIYYKSPQE